MRNRIIIAAILIGLVTSGFFVKSLSFVPLVLLLALGLIAVRELGGMFRERGLRVSQRVTMLIVSALTLLAWTNHMDLGLPVVGMAVILGFLWRMFQDPLEGAWKDVAATCGASLYIGVPLALMADLFLQGTEGKIWLWWMLTVIWFTDSGAFFVGKFFGKTKLYPKLSPNKTREGAFGGVVGAFITLLIHASIFGSTIGAANPVELVILTLIMSVLVQLGDLAESLLKRDAGVKDSGRVLAGHGGALDRVDSMLYVVVPFILYLNIFHPEVFVR